MKTINEIANTPRINILQTGADGLAFRWNDGKWDYIVIVSDGGGWDHVSVSCRNKRVTPSWDVMCKIKDICFDPEEVVIQYHPRESEYVDLKTNCLHLWQPQAIEIPIPPINFV